jgi:hypothetical protein
MAVSEVGMAKHATLALGLLCLGTTLAADKPRDQRVFLLAGVEAVGDEARCAQTVAATLKAEIDKTPGVVGAKSSDEADVHVDVKECAAVRWEIDPEFELNASNSKGRKTRGGRVGVGIGVPAEARGKVALSADKEGRTQTFTSGPQELPLDDASRVAVRGLLEWVRSDAAH